jgi:hypothetical protein
MDICTLCYVGEICFPEQLVGELESVSVLKNECPHSNCGTGPSNVQKGMKLSLLIYHNWHCSRIIYGVRVPNISMIPFLACIVVYFYQ